MAPTHTHTIPGPNGSRTARELVKALLRRGTTPIKSFRELNGLTPSGCLNINGPQLSEILTHPVVSIFPYNMLKNLIPDTACAPVTDCVEAVAMITYANRLKTVGQMRELNNFLKNLDLTTRSNKTMRHGNDDDLFLEEDEPLDGISLEATMPELVDSQIEGLNFYTVDVHSAVAFDPREIRIPARTLTVKSMTAFNEGDMILWGERDTCVGAIKAKVEQPTNYKNPRSYPWVISSLDTTDYETHKQYEKDMALAIQSSMRENRRQSVIQQLLGSSFKAPALPKADES